MQACLGENQCNVPAGYEQVALCVVCTKGFFRDTGLCKKCPSVNWGAMLGLLVLLIYLLYHLTKITEITRWVGSFRVFFTFIATSVRAERVMFSPTRPSYVPARPG
jgi:hypothetical protein